jgi:hypothetical protein
MFSTELKSKKAPMEKKPLPIIGMIQWISLLALHPNQDRQIGIQKAPTKAGWILISG